MNLNEMLKDHPIANKQKDLENLVRKWEKTQLLEGLSESKKTTIACLLENEAYVLKNQLLTETSSTSTTSGFESWSNVALPLVRRVFAKLLANEIVGVQPMTLPSGLVFYLDYQFGTGKPLGSASSDQFLQGNSVYGNTSGAASGSDMGGYYGGWRYGYTMNFISGSAVTCTTGVDNTSGGTLQMTWADVEYNPLLSASVAGHQLYKIYIASGVLPSLDVSNVKQISVSDPQIDRLYREYTKADATGGISLIVTGVFHETGSIDFVSYIRKTYQDWRGDFEYGKGQSATIPEVNLVITSKPVVAQTRRMKAIWTPEMQQDISAYHNVDAEAELTGILSEQTALEIDREILADLLTRASTSRYWSRNNGTFVNSDGSVISGTGTIYGTQQEWYQTLVETILEVSNQIYKRTLRGAGNWIVTSPEIASMLQATNTFMSDKVTNGTDTNFNVGIEKVGVLSNRWSVYIDPLFPPNKILVGFKGNNFLETGYVYCPYVPFVLTPTILDPDFFVPRKALMTRYAKAPIRDEFYGTITVRDMRF